MKQTLLQFIILSLTLYACSNNPNRSKSFINSTTLYLETFKNTSDHINGCGEVFDRDAKAVEMNDFIIETGTSEQMDSIAIIKVDRMDVVLQLSKKSQNENKVIYEEYVNPKYSLKLTYKETRIEKGFRINVADGEVELRRGSNILKFNVFGERVC